MINPNEKIPVTDPELEEIMKHFMKDEVEVRNKQVDGTTKQLISVVSLVVQQSTVMLKLQVEGALLAGVTPVAIREAVYHCAPYAGFPRVLEALETVNQVFTGQQIELPLADQGTVNEENRFEQGLNAQAAIFGEDMRQAAVNGPDQMPRSGYHLVTNCFGDYYTRAGLDLKIRELLTLCILVNLGTESQIRSHIIGNIRMGRTKDYLTEVMYQCLPFTGYPRLLNALAGLNEVVPDEGAEGSEAEELPKRN